MKYQVLKGRINGKGIGEIVNLPENIGNAYGSLYLKPLEKPSIINQIKDFTNIKNKALKPNKKGRK